MVKLKASTLIEVLVAMVIISISFAIGLAVITNVINSSNQKQKLDAFLLADSVAVQTIKEERYFDENYEFENFNLVKTVHQHQKNNNLEIIQIAVFDKTKKKILTKKWIQFTQENASKNKLQK